MINNKKLPKKSTECCIVYSKLTPLTRDATYSKLQRYGENVGDKKLSMEHTPTLCPLNNSEFKQFP